MSSRSACSLATFAGLVFVVSACSKTTTTPPGPLGEVDLRPQLPSGVTAPPDAQLVTHEAKRVVCGVDDGHPGAEVKISWKTFERDGNGYIVSATFEVTKPADALELTGPKSGSGASVGSSNLAPHTPYRALATVSIGCKREMFRFSQVGPDTVQFDVDGKILEPKTFKVL